MKLLSIAAKGVLCYEQELRLDFTLLPPGLIAVIGPNGGGKSTLLELPVAGLYRQFASRDGELLAYALDRDSYVETAFEIEGHGEFRSRVNLDPVRRASEAVLTRRGNGGVEVLSDGRLRSFDSAIAQWFPGKDVLLASAFAAQNKAGSFVSLDRKGRRDLFAQLLGLAHYEAWAQAARSASSLIDTTRIRLLERQALLERSCTLAIAEALQQLADAIRLERATAEQQQRTVDEAIARAEAERAGVQTQVTRHREAEVRLEGAQTDLARVEAEQEAARRRLLLEPSALATAVTRVEEETGAVLQDIEQRLAGNRTLQGRAAEIRAAVTRVEALQVEIRDARARETELQAVADRLSVERQRVREALLAVASAEREIAGIQQRVSLLGQVPCEGAGPYARCQFLAEATAGRKRLPVLETQVAVRAALEADQTAVGASRTQVTSHLDLVRRILTTAEREIEQLGAVTKLAGPLAAAEARIVELEARRDTASDQRTREIGRLSTESATRSAGIAEEIDALTREQAQIAAVQDDLQRALAATASATRTAAGLEAQLAGLRRDREATTATLARVDVEKRQLNERSKAFRAALADLETVRGHLVALETDWLEWQVLTRAFTRDGLPTLEIDAAGPTVSAMCNDLLLACFGPRFSVEVVTQVAKASGKGVREEFTIKVFDNERGGEWRDIADLSGGEQVVVNEALANAIALYLNTRTATPIQTAWRDETVGALDPDNAIRYVLMLRRVLEIGGFHHILYVSHNLSAAAMADAQLRVAHGAVAVVLPPFQEAAA